MIEQVLGDDELEDRVAQEFQTLIVEMTLLRFVTETRVRQRFGEQKRIAKLVIDSFLERMHLSVFDKFLATSQHRARVAARRRASVSRELGRAAARRSRVLDWFLPSTPLHSNAAARFRRQTSTFPCPRWLGKFRAWPQPTARLADQGLLR